MPTGGVAARRHVSPMVGLVLLAVAIHAPFARGGFLTDDFLHLERLERQSIAGIVLTPDTFGFYRPVPEASLWLNLRLTGSGALPMRLTNVLIHAIVIAAAYFVARLLLARPRAAGLATLAFVLTPKAHPVAVLWISARAELLMSLFTLCSVICWMKWHRGARASWLGLSWLCYVLALLSKETAILLPLLLILTPPSAPLLTRPRVLAAAGMMVTAALIMAVRLHVGALMPVSVDAHYDLSTPVGRWVRNARNYFWRAIVSPLALVVMMSIARLPARGPGASRLTIDRAFPPLALYSVVWFAVFLLPVLPILARSELYLYLPVFGLCLFAGTLADMLLANRSVRAMPAVAALAVYVVAIAGFQLSRAAALHEDASFSAKFLAAVRESDAIARHEGSIVFIPADETTRRYLQDSIGGYIGTAIDRALGRHVPAGLATAEKAAEADALRLSCLYEHGRIRLTPLRP